MTPRQPLQESKLPRRAWRIEVCDGCDRPRSDMSHGRCPTPFRGHYVEVVPVEQLRGAVEQRDRYRKALERIWAAGGYASPEPLKQIAREALDA